MGSYRYERTLYIYTVNTSRRFWVLDRPSPAAYEAGTRPGRTTYRVMTPPDQDVKTHPTAVSPSSRASAAGRLAAERDDPARDPGAAVAGRIRAEVVGVLVHDERAAVVVEDGVGPRLDGDAGAGELEVALVVVVHGEVGQIAGVRPLRVVQPVSDLGRVEVRPRRVERWRNALAHVVDVHPLDAGREPLHVEQDPDAVAFLNEHAAAYHLAGRVLERHTRRRRGRRDAGHVRQAARGQGERENQNARGAPHG